MLVKAGALHHSMCDRVSFQSLSRDYNVSRKLEKGKLRIEMLDYIEEKYKIDIKDIPRKGLVLELLLFEGSGNDVHDTSSYGNHGISADGYGIFGATWKKLITGKYILHCDGIDDRILIPHSDIFNTSQLTICFWIRTTETRNWRYPLAKEGAQPFASGVKGWRFNLGVSASTLYFDLSEEVNNCVRLKGVKITDGNWHFIVGWWDGSEAMLYVDMELIDSKSFSGDISNTKYISIGSSYGPGAWCVCDVGIVRIYNRALSESEISEIYETEKYMFG